MPQYEKPALSTDQQIDLLIRRGMAVADRALAKRHFTHISYYRLRAYWLPFEAASVDRSDHSFVVGTELNVVIAIYDFDRELRLLLIDAIERVEISLRAKLANVLSLRHGPFAHQSDAYFSDRQRWQRNYTELLKECARSHETFAKHYRSEYPELICPPLWVACELMTLGQLSRWLQNIRAPSVRQAIADEYGLDEKVLVSFVHHLTVVRNHCAHHGRVWNRRFSLKMKIPGKKLAWLSAQFNTLNDRNIYNTLTMLAYLMGVICPASNWARRIVALIQATPCVAVADMGFPLGWENMSVWQKKSWV
jgi:abortive infection bacteriophage resistance protein